MKGKLVHVAVGVIEDTAGRILIARRPEHLHQGGLWEFPGGKVEENEDVITALSRELTEEIGIELKQSRPLISLKHDYRDKQVWLDVHRVTQFQGSACGREGQPVKWVTRAELSKHDFPAANRAIVNAIQLPDRYMITGEFDSIAGLNQKIQVAAGQGLRLVQFRAKHLSDAEYLKVARELLSVRPQDMTILVNTSLENFHQLNAAGLHLTSQGLTQYTQRPIELTKLLSVSVHNKQELVQANQIGADMVLISPVRPTKSHPGATPLGWEGFSELVEMANCVVYALGGMTGKDVSQARLLGAQGIAGIGDFWPAT